MNKCLRETCDWEYHCQGCPKDPAVSFRQQLEEARQHARLIQARSVNMADELETTLQALSQAQAALGEAAEKTCRAVMPVLKSYRCQYTADPDGSGLALVDKLCAPDGCDIYTGNKEMGLLEDAICGAIIDVLSSPPAQAAARILAVLETVRFMRKTLEERKDYVMLPANGQQAYESVCYALAALDREEDKSIPPVVTAEAGEGDES